MILRTAALSGLALLAVPASALAFGTNPIPISVGANGQGANGPSGGATISGDNRKGRLVAFHSEATNLVAGDTNGVADIFVYSRPRGARGNVRLDAGPARPSGGLRRVSVTNSGGQANGRSLNPALDGRLLIGDGNVGPHCVAFQSEASNLNGADHDNTSDIYVRDLRRNRTILVSRGVGAAATNPAIDGRCRTVGFEAGGRAYLAQVGGSVQSFGRGGDVDLAFDGQGVIWRAGGGKIKLRREGRHVDGRTGLQPDACPTAHIWGRATSGASASKPAPAWSAATTTRGSMSTCGRSARPAGRAEHGPHLLLRGAARAASAATTRTAALTAYGGRKRGIVVFVNHRRVGIDPLLPQQQLGQHRRPRGRRQGPGRRPAAAG